MTSAGSPTQWAGKNRRDGPRAINRGTTGSSLIRRAGPTSTQLEMGSSFLQAGHTFNGIAYNVDMDGPLVRAYAAFVERLDT